MSVLRGSTLSCLCLGLLIALPVSADKCDSMTGGTLDCRDLKKGSNEIGGSSCISRALEARPIREVLTDDAWKTVNDIKLDVVSHASQTCVPKAMFAKDDVVVVSGKDGKLFLSITTVTGRVVVNKAELTKDASKLWLSTLVGQTMFYVYLYDHPAGADELPKYLLIETFDQTDGNCKTEEPKIGHNVFVHQNPQQDKCPLGPRVTSAGPSDGGPLGLETGVGGGGEGK